MIEDIYKFEWPVDQAGYEVKRWPVSPPPPFNVDPVTKIPVVEMDVQHVVGRGGRRRYYHPMDGGHLGLWRTFAETCTCTEGVMSFVRAYGLLSQAPGRLDDIIGTAAIIREIAEPYEAGRLDAAATRFNRFAHGGLIIPVLVRDDQKARSRAAITNKTASPWALRFAPGNLFGALILQVGDAISGGHRFRPCRNESCAVWFLVGRDAGTIRKEFCTARCRAASARRQKSMRDINLPRGEKGG